MVCGVRPPQGLGIKAVIYEYLVLKINFLCLNQFLVLKISNLLFLQGGDDIYSNIIPTFDIR